MSKKTDFFYTEVKDLHFERPIEIIKEHPEIRSYMGRTPATFFIVFGIVTLQVALCWLMPSVPWWAVIAIAWLVGAFIDHALFVMIHECAHNLLFQKKPANMLTGIFANSVMFFPSSVSFGRYHLKHHAHQGIPELDGDLPSEWEGKVFNNSTFGKAMWLLFYPVIQSLRVARLREVKPFDKWVALNFLIVFGVDALMWYLFGVKAFVYLGASLFFSVGLHPLGGRWVQEHYLTSDDVQETHSYYGPLNTVAFNVGYHNEHHDFPSIPWNNLPKVRKAGEKWYNGIAYHNSWTMLWLRFIFDRNISIYSRMLRKRHEKKGSPSKAKAA
ncbi:MAG TPA: fatty acid desaturase [Bacteroidia bacterium]|jgi:sphingolipid delta-4 desaturase|nr:fatty acid desaturase [Bacteroidia bacterium]